MLKIGFIDHHLTNYHSDVFLENLRGEIGAGTEVVCAFESCPAEGRDWCAEKNVPRAASAEEVVEKSDAIIVLCPDCIGEHIKLGVPAFASGKPVLIDKYLAPNLADAKAIVAACEAGKSPFMSASSLTFATEVQAVAAEMDAQPDQVFARGMGNWHGYGIHTIAPALRLFGGKVDRLIDTSAGNARFVTLADGERRCTIEVREAENQYDAFMWTVGATAGAKYAFGVVTDHAAFYGNLMRQAVAFFRTRQSPLTVGQMLLTVAVEEMADVSRERGGEWVKIDI